MKQGENRAAFFARVARWCTPDSQAYQSIARAYQTAEDAFRDVVRDDGNRYFEHLRAVALILMDDLNVRDHRTICAALLHDIVEDIPGWTIERVEVEFGIEVAIRVAWLTKPLEGLVADTRERHALYARRFFSAPRDVVLVKLADRLHNMRTVDGCTPEKRARFIQETKRHYLPLAERHGVLRKELRATLTAT